jgi:hypothetical protein
MDAGQEEGIWRTSSSEITRMLTARIEVDRDSFLLFFWLRADLSLFWVWTSSLNSFQKFTDRLSTGCHRWTLEISHAVSDNPSSDMSPTSSEIVIRNSRYYVCRDEPHNQILGESFLSFHQLDVPDRHHWSCLGILLHLGACLRWNDLRGLPEHPLIVKETSVMTKTAKYDLIQFSRNISIKPTSAQTSYTRYALLDANRYEPMRWRRGVVTSTP